MQIGRNSVKIFRIRNRKGYAAICADCLTEGRSSTEALDRMIKAIKRVESKIKTKARKK